MDYIAIEGETPRPLDDLRTLLPAVSFPEDDLLYAIDFSDFIALAGYEVCTITNLASDITPAWNQYVELGVATRVNGVLEAAYVAENMDAELSAATLTEAKDSGQSSVDETTATTQNAATGFGTGLNAGDPPVSLRPDAETVANLSQLLLVAQNANTGATVVDANGSSVALTLPQLQTLTAAVVEANADLTAARATARASIAAATSPTAVTVAVTTFNDQYPNT